MKYTVKECFVTLQGEGVRAGRAAVFCRFAGCNLWNGREQDRAASICTFCDTDFLGSDGPGGGTFPVAAELADHVESVWQQRITAPGSRLVVFTGGEPLLQLDHAIVQACHARGFEVAIETNGTLPCVEGVDWVCVSPKSIDRLVLRKGHELKLVYPQPSMEPRMFEGMEFEHFLLQPMDGPQLQANTRACIDYCLLHPKWRLSIQQHKVLGIR